ncbi:MAG: hypothetical protein R3C61_15810 [Bacteroidia bacterium]
MNKNTFRNAVIRILVPIFLAIGVSSCYYDNEEDLYPASTNTCDTTNITYASVVQPLLQNRCYVCHDAATKSGNIALDTYTDVLKMVNNGKLWGAINHSEGYVPMPDDEPKLGDCTLAKVKAWIDSGAPNN